MLPAPPCGCRFSLVLGEAAISKRRLQDESGGHGVGPFIRFPRPTRTFRCAVRGSERCPFVWEGGRRYSLDFMTARQPRPEVKPLADAASQAPKQPCGSQPFSKLRHPSRTPWSEPGTQCTHAVAVFSDSRTLVNQVNRLWKSSGHLAEYCEKAWNALAEFSGWQMSWIPRKWNERAEKCVKRGVRFCGQGRRYHARGGLERRGTRSLLRPNCVHRITGYRGMSPTVRKIRVHQLLRETVLVAGLPRFRCKRSAPSVWAQVSAHRLH
jgi:hypothetical protein